MNTLGIECKCISCNVWDFVLILAKGKNNFRIDPFIN